MSRAQVREGKVSEQDRLYIHLSPGQREEVSDSVGS